MAVLSPTLNTALMLRSGSADCIVLLSLRNVNTGDTLDVGSSGSNLLQVINRAVVISVTSFVEIAASFTGTVITMPSGLSADAGYLLMWGSST